MSEVWGGVGATDCVDDGASADELVGDPVEPEHDLNVDDFDDEPNDPEGE